MILSIFGILFYTIVNITYEVLMFKKKNGIYFIILLYYRTKMISLNQRKHSIIYRRRVCKIFSGTFQDVSY